MKWIGAVATVLLLVIWLGSVWYHFFFDWSDSYFGFVGYGRLHLFWGEPWWQRHGWSLVADGPHEIKWWFDARSKSANYYAAVFIPIWSVALLTGTPTVLMWRQDRRRRLAELSNSCHKCGYSRSGLPAHRPCPECGTPRELQS